MTQVTLISNRLVVGFSGGRVRVDIFRPVGRGSIWNQIGKALSYLALTAQMRVPPSQNKIKC